MTYFTLDVSNDKYPSPLEFECNYICGEDNGCYEYCLKYHAQNQPLNPYLRPGYAAAPPTAVAEKKATGAAPAAPAAKAPAKAAAKAPEKKDAGKK